MDARILEEGSDDEENEEFEAETHKNKKSGSKPKPEEFGPLPKPIKTQKKTFKEKFKSFFTRSKKKENVMGKHDTKKIQDQEFGEIITFEMEKPANAHTKDMKKGFK